MALMKKTLYLRSLFINHEGSHGLAMAQNKTSASTLRTDTRASKVKDGEDLDVIVNFIKCPFSSVASSIILFVVILSAAAFKRWHYQN